MKFILPPRLKFHTLNIGIVATFFLLILLQNLFGNTWTLYQKELKILTHISPSPTPQVLAVTDDKMWTVTKVIDGDTIEIEFDGTKDTVRLLGIDTPETKDPRKPVQCFGKEASAKTSELLLGALVRLESDQSQSNRDAYKRLLRYVFKEDGLFINKYLVEEGYAYEYTYKSNPGKYQEDFIEAQNMARERKKGLWGDNVCPHDPRAVTTMPTRAR
ncbi:MAG: Thermonuclease precursor [Microgenomates bacterium OLB23]|nr:MAG: Thermonuclease precursor [Microgenomates bacterium OLB23]